MRAAPGDTITGGVTPKRTNANLTEQSVLKSVIKYKNGATRASGAYLHKIQIQSCSVEQKLVLYAKAPINDASSHVVPGIMAIRQLVSLR